MGEKLENCKIYFIIEDGEMLTDANISDAENILDDEKNAELERVTTFPTDSELSIEIKDKKSIKKLKKLTKLKWYEKLIIILRLQRLKKLVKCLEKGNEKCDTTRSNYKNKRA